MQESNRVHLDAKPRRHGSTPVVVDVNRKRVSPSHQRPIHELGRRPFEVSAWRISPMRRRSTNDDLSAAIAAMRETAIQIRDLTHDAVLVAQIDLALRDLEEIPRLFDSEREMRDALTLPQARIRWVQETLRQPKSGR